MAALASIASWVPLKQRLLHELDIPKPLAYFASASEMITMKALEILNHLSKDPETKVVGFEKISEGVMRISLNFMWLEFLEGDIKEHVKTWGLLLTALKKECEVLVASKKIKDVKAAEELSKTFLFAFLYLKNEAPEGMTRPMVAFMDLEKHPLTEDLLRRYVDHFSQEYGSLVKLRDWRHPEIEKVIAHPIWFDGRSYIEKRLDVETVLLNFAYRIRVVYHTIVEKLGRIEAHGGAGRDPKKQKGLGSKGVLLSPYFKKSLQLYSAFASYFNSKLLPPKQNRLILDVPIATIFNWQVESMKRIILKLKGSLPKIEALGKPLHDVVLADVERVHLSISHADLPYLDYLEEYAHTVLSSESSTICLLIEREMFARSSRDRVCTDYSALIELFNTEYKKSWEAAQLTKEGADYRYGLVELAPLLKAWIILRESIDEMGMLSMEDSLELTPARDLIPLQEKIRSLFYAFDDTPSIVDVRLPCPIEFEMFCPWPEVRALFLGVLS